ncbi:MAG: TrmB family transcriptional regulator [Spirochaetales bacterium]|nr:TrmB family transcriptional regulator [Spirochaetales bacterium]
MNEIIESLEKFGFSRTEASVYLNLVQKGARNGSQIAKDLNISRSSIYSALENLYSRAVVYLLQAESRTYKAEDPDLLFEKLKKTYCHSADFLRKRLTELNKNEDNSYYLNIRGFENFLEKAKQLLLSAETEIYINTCIDLNLFSSELKTLEKRNIRVIVFTFTDLKPGDLPVEYYYNSIRPSEIDEIRMMLVIDRQKTLIGSSGKDGEVIGTFTDNPLLVSIVSEHIHQDIYLLKLREKYRKDLIGKDILLGTLQENQ